MFSFKKEERLSSKKTIGFLFKKGRSFTEHPFKLIWIKTALNTKQPVQICISIPKKHIKLAVNRNIIKRRTKEAYRLNKSIINEYFAKKETQLAVMLIYQSNKILDYNDIKDKIIVILPRLIKEYEKHS
ncbi:MAG: ribonuclease P protein component [Bacteroidales bacterium]|nr:ribonuclease P protein component [Bacteroidales bacterium]